MVHCTTGKNFVTTEIIGEDNMIRSCAKLNLIITFTTINDHSAIASVQQPVRMVPASQRDRCVYSRTDFNIVVARTTVGDDAGHSTEVLSTSEGLHAQDFTRIFGVICNFCDQESLILLVFGFIPHMGSGAHIQIQNSLIKACTSDIVPVSSKINRLLNFYIEQVKCCSYYYFKKQKINLNPRCDIYAPCGAFQPEIDPGTGQSKPEELYRP